MLSVPNQCAEVQGPVNLSRGAGADGSVVHSNGAKIATITAKKNIDKPTAIFGCLFKRVKTSLILSFIVSSGGFTQADLDVPVLFIGYLYLILGSSTP